MQVRPIRIVVTGEHEDLESGFPGELGHQGNALEWIPLSVLRFERLPVEKDWLEALLKNPPDWIVFTSPRSVEFFSDILMEAGLDFPIQTQVGCIGGRTAEAASNDGFTPDFYPTEPGTEKFLEEFADLVSNNSLKPSVFIPMAESGRTALKKGLSDMGCRVTILPLYRTYPRPPAEILARLSQKELDASALIVFTSPSSFDAFRSCYVIPEGVRTGAIGQFTSRHLTQAGLADHKILPQGDFENVGDLLC